MIKSKKFRSWKTKDYVRIISWFAAHAFIMALGFIFIIYANANFDAKVALDFVTSKGVTGSLIYALIANLLIAVGVFLYFYNEDRDFIYYTKNINLVFCIFEISIAIMFIVGKYSVYCRPFALCALLALLLIDKRTAIFMNAISCFLMFMVDAFLQINPLENHLLYSSLLVGFTTSVLAVYLVQGNSSRLKVFLMGFVISIPVILAIICLEFSAVLKNPIQLIIYGFTSGMLSVVLMMAIIPAMERLFNVVTDYRLTELTDHKAPLIRSLIEKAPGTFNHALVVSTLAEYCASAIGENPILARACAYYHDIGKLNKPEFFTENQSGYNPHDELTPELSTDIIRAHTTDGSALIKKYGLPQILADVACQHHGKSLIKYFYIKAKKFSEEELDKDNFSYGGPRPQTKIAAIIMIADCCEAISRSLPDRSHASVSAAVKSLIEERRADGEFSECELTMKDLDIIRKVLTNSLVGVYHDRIEYPKDEAPKKKARK